MVEYLHKHLRALPLDRQQEVVQSVMQWIKQSELEEICYSFMRNVADLVGLSIDAP
jgi:hypothetical protein